VSTPLVLATRNRHKIEEIRAVLADLGFELSSAADHPGVPEVEEDAATLEGNAEKKARWVCAATGLRALADDTGLEVDALCGAPGVISARWAGEGCSYADNNAKLLRELTGVAPERRSARFRCVIAIATPPPAGDTGDFAARVGACRVTLHEGRIEGRIADAPRGAHGFGYDPVFWIPELGRTLAELDAAEKNRTSHRARALAAARAALARSA
jgi:XTP/dITP diphosphohydrolase